MQYINAEAPVLRKNGKRSSQLREEGNKVYMAKKNAKVIYEPPPGNPNLCCVTRH